jgi:hypothetical protein
MRIYRYYYLTFPNNFHTSNSSAQPIRTIFYLKHTKNIEDRANSQRILSSVFMIKVQPNLRH